MARTILAFVVIFVLLIAIGFFIYVFYEKPIQDNINNNYVSLNINAHENDSDSQLITGYKVYVEDSFYNEGETLENGFIRVNVPTNKSFYILNSNLGDQNYYTNFIEFDSISIQESKRITLLLINSGKVNFSYSGSLINEAVDLKILGEGEIRNFIFCVRYSLGILTLNVLGEHEIIDPPDRYKYKVDKCYNPMFDLSDNEIIIPLRFKVFGSDVENEFIEIIIIDGDEISKNNIVYEIEGEDLWAEDFKFIIDN